MYSLDERETHVYYDQATRTWKAWTNIPKHMRKLEKCGWDMVECNMEDGKPIDMTFTTTKSAVTFRSVIGKSGSQDDSENACESDDFCNI